MHTDLYVDNISQLSLKLHDVQHTINDTEHGQMPPNALTTEVPL